MKEKFSLARWFKNSVCEFFGHKEKFEHNIFKDYEVWSCSRCGRFIHYPKSKERMKIK